MIPTDESWQFLCKCMWQRLCPVLCPSYRMLRSACTFTVRTSKRSISAGLLT